MYSEYRSIRELLDERQQYLDSIKLYEKELTETEEILKEKEAELKKLLSTDSFASTILTNIMDYTQYEAVSIPLNRITDMDDSMRRDLIVKIAINKLIINELEKKIKNILSCRPK